MSRNTLLILLVVILGIWLFAMTFTKDMYKILPINAPSVEDWYEYTSPNQKFIVMFPTKPNRLERDYEDPNTAEKKEYDFFAARDEQGTNYMIASITYQKEPFLSRDDLLKTSIDDMVKTNPNNTLTKIEREKYQNEESYSFSIVNEITRKDGIIFMYDNTLYVISAESAIQRYTPTRVEFFMGSFQLIPQFPKENRE